MAGPIHESLRKFHASLNVTDINRSIAFYRVLLDTEPAKVRSDYAKFELAEPPLILSLIPGRSSGGVNHVGLRVRNTDELVEVQRRLEMAGIHTRREEGVECCYARQTKFWVTDPDAMLWEIYIFHEDIDERGDATVPLATIVPATPPMATAPIAPADWKHRLGAPFPETIPHDSDSLVEISLDGSINAKPGTANRNLLITESLRVLRPGGEIRIHGLAGDSACADENLSLPGPASAVEYVPTAAEVADELTRAGFVDVHVETLSEKAYFNVAGVSMRELRIRAKKPGHRPKQKTHYAIYRGPLAVVTDDYGNTFRRGELTPLNIHDWQMLSKSAAGTSFLLLTPKSHGVESTCSQER